MADRGDAGEAGSPAGGSSRWAGGWWEPVGLYLAAATLLGALAVARHPQGWPGFVEAVRGAAGDYLVTATVGYPQGTWRLATFPGFAMAIRGTSEVVPGLDVAGAAVLLAALGGALTALTVWWWCGTRGMPDTARRWAVLALLASPAAFVLLDNPQSEAIYLPAVFGACVAVERRRPGLAAALLVVASITRLTAVLFAVVLVVRIWEQDGVLTPVADRLRPNWDGARLAVRQFVPLLGAAGAVAFLLYTWRVHGSPLVFFREQSALIPSGPRWHPATWAHWGLVQRAGDLWASPGYLVETVTNLTFIGLCAWSTPAVRRRFGDAYALLVVGHVVMVWFLAYNFTSTSRYLLGVLPVFAWAGLRLAERRRVAFVVLAGSAAVMLWFGSVFPNGVALA